ncbi:MAG: cupin domain-containing protein [Planctomycetaceae bacterium]|nr:cupin domain-containing protein [Planctomycetaceae bacterium]
MKRTPLFVAIFIAIVSVFFFSGQVTRPFAQPQQQPQRQQTWVQPRQQTLPQQRQAVQQPQRQVAPAPTPPPPRPVTVAAPTSTPPAIPAVSEMPPLFWLPEDIKFPEMPPGGSPTVRLFGDPTAEGLYVTRTLIPHGIKTLPHTHSDNRTVTVLSGVCYYGRGEESDENPPIPMPPGSFFTEPTGTPHYIWAKDGDVVVQTTGIGPSGTQFVPGRR